MSEFQDNGNLMNATPTKAQLAQRESFRARMRAKGLLPAVLDEKNKTRR